MRIAVITDAHGNLPALQAALSATAQLDCAKVFHTGDAIAIGPYPRECVELLLNTPNVTCLKGNHESYYVQGLSYPLPDGMGEGELAHQRWVHQQLGDDLRAEIAQWPLVVRLCANETRIALMHYAIGPDDRYVDMVRDPDVAHLDAVFHEDADFCFFGHNHRACQARGYSVYMNPGSLGCQATAIAPFAFLDTDRARIERITVAYDDTAFLRAFNEREVPDRAFIIEKLLGRTTTAI